MAAADAGQHGGDMAIADLERLPELPVAPGDARQAPLEGGDRKLGPTAFDLGSEIEADRFRIGRRFGKPLAAQPGSEHSPVRGVGALGVIGLSGAGVVLGGLGERRKAAAEASGGREQGRGVCAWSLGLERHAFRLSAIPGAFVKTALRVGWRAGADRGGAACGANPARPGGGAWRGDLVPPGFRGLGVVWPPGLRRTAERGDAAQLRRGPRCSRAGELGRGRGGGPRQLGLRPGAIRRLGVVPGISGRAPLRARWSKGLGCGRLQVLAKPGVGGRAAAQRVAPCFPTPRRAQRSPPERPLGGQEGRKAWFCGVWHGVWAGFRIMSDNAILSDIATPRQAGRIACQTGDKAPRRTHHARVIRADLDLARRPPARPREARCRAARDSARARSQDPRRKPRKHKPFHRRRRSRPGRGRAEGQGRAIPLCRRRRRSRSSTPSCAATRPPPGRCARAWRFRAPRPPPKFCASTPTQPRCATCASPSATLGPAREPPSALARSRRPAAQPRPRPARRRGGARSTWPWTPRPRIQPEGLRRGGRSGLGGREGRRPGVLHRPGRPGGRLRNFRALGVRHGRRPSAALAAARAADRDENSGPDPAVGRAQADGRGRATQPGQTPPPAAIALAAASALDLAADLSRRSNTLIAVAPKLRSKPAQKIVDLLLSQDCVSPAEAARHAPMTDRAARRLFDRLVLLGAARELSGRPTFRLYGL